MEMFYYTLAAIVLYGISDYILNTIEMRIGKRLPNRSFYFLIIITVLALITFSVVRALVVPIKAPQQTSTTQTQTADKVQQSSKETGK